MTTQPSVTVRDAAPGDMDAIVGLVAELGYPTPAHVVRERLATLAANGGAALVAVADGRAVGLATMQATHYLHRPPDARLSTLVVTESRRGRGIGGVLLQATERWGAEHGCARVQLTSGMRRPEAHAFYERMGYDTRSRVFVKELPAASPSSGSAGAADAWAGETG
ncbi:MAG: GCN5-related N-acetyltransferase [Gemmatimonadetes bacterium]|nr:GCN5-related N-acetyltransferase [Gemmatimonadota bacterium]